MDPLCFILICLAGWVNLEQQAVIEYLREEIRILREHIPKKRIPFSDEQRCQKGMTWPEFLRVHRGGWQRVLIIPGTNGGSWPKPRPDIHPDKDPLGLSFGSFEGLNFIRMRLNFRQDLAAFSNHR